MGYDMTIKGELPAADPHEVEQARAALDAAAAAHRARMDTDRAAGTYTHDRCDASAKEANELQGKYSALAYPGDFRLNIFGMSRYRSAMHNLSMIHESTDPNTTEDWLTLPEDDSEGDAYYEAKDKLTARHGDSPLPTIPSHKLCSNDGWLVTPDEIRATLAEWDDKDAVVLLSEENDEAIQTEYWAKWIAYLRLAAEHDGFRVH